MKDILNFNKMVTPIIIQVIFWVGIVAIIIAAFQQNFLQGILMIIFGSLIWRVYCELMIVIFQINKNVHILTEGKSSSGSSDSSSNSPTDSENI